MNTIQEISKIFKNCFTYNFINACNNIQLRDIPDRITLLSAILI